MKHTMVSRMLWFRSRRSIVGFVNALPFCESVTYATMFPAMCVRVREVCVQDALVSQQRWVLPVLESVSCASMFHAMCVCVREVCVQDALVPRENQHRGVLTF